MRFIKKFNESKKVNDFGCVMIYLKFKNWNKIQKEINDDDLYIDENDDSYGIEDNPHATIAYGIHNIKDDKILDDLKAIEPIKLEIKNVSLFEKDKFDVLKFDLKSDVLTELNTYFLDKYPNTNEFDYKPHCTIAYLKPGKGKKYIKSISLDQEFSCYKVVYSKIDGSKLEFKL